MGPAAPRPDRSSSDDRRVGKRVEELKRTAGRLNGGGCRGQSQPPGDERPVIKPGAEVSQTTQKSYRKDTCMRRGPPSIALYWPNVAGSSRLRFSEAVSKYGVLVRLKISKRTAKL
jgi:hypothetical protein